MLAKRLIVIVALCLGATALVACGPSPEQIGSNVQASMQQTFSTDPNLSQFNLRVTKVVVVKEHGNKYQGMATVFTKKGTEKQVAVEVTAEGDNVIWKTEHGALLFAAQEELSEILGR